MSNDSRKNPEYFLNLLREESVQSEKSVKGRLKIFLGYVAGVGKTYRMLSEAMLLCENKEDVIAGIVETHGREETEALLFAIDVFPRKKMEYGGIMLEEMDSDGILARKPEYVLVDELAHTNVPGSRHEKRYQDVEELLNAGINVFTCLNVQHVESINDIVYQITGVRVKETVPDKILEMADKIELVDLPTDQLIQRLREGKVYIPEKAKTAVSRFFKNANLLALRELALRYTANRVEDDILTYKKAHDLKGAIPVGSKLLVCVSGSPSSQELIRITHRYADELRSEWFAVYVQSPQGINTGQDQLNRNIRLAEELGAKIIRLSGNNISDTITEFAKSKNVRLMVIGYSQRSRIQQIMKGSIIEETVRKSYPIQVLIASGKQEKITLPPKEKSLITFQKSYITAVIISIVSVSLTTAVLYVIQTFLHTSDIGILYLIPIVLSSISSGMLGGIFASVFSVLAFNFFFTEPYFTFYFYDKHFFITFTILMFVGIITSFLADIVKRQSEAAKEREKFISMLYDFSKELLRSQNFETLLTHIISTVAELSDAKTYVLLPDRTMKLRTAKCSSDAPHLNTHEMSIAQWAYVHKERAGFRTQTFASSDSVYIPLRVKEDIAVGVLVLKPDDKVSFMLHQDEHLLESFVAVVSMALANFHEMIF
jgi:two-component system sensor histidine kinase KdpD